MTDKTFDLLDALNREGFDNSQLGFAQNIESIATHFACIDDMCIKSKFVYIYVENKDLDSLSFIRNFPPHLILTLQMEPNDEKVLIYLLE